MHTFKKFKSAQLFKKNKPNRDQKYCKDKTTLDDVLPPFIVQLSECHILVDDKRLGFWSVGMSYQRHYYLYLLFSTQHTVEEEKTDVPGVTTMS